MLDFGIRSSKREDLEQAKDQQGLSYGVASIHYTEPGAEDQPASRYRG